MISGLSGNLTFDSDGTPRITGSFSGLDTAALVEASLQIKRLPAVRLENRITENETKQAAYGSLNTLMQTLSSALDGLRNPPGLTGITINTFEQKSAFLSSSSTTAASEIFGVEATNTAAKGVYEVEVLQIATAHKVAGTTLADSSAALGVTETLTVKLNGAAAEETATIDVNATMSAADVVSAVNTLSATTGVRASLVQVSSSDFRVVFTAEKTNKNIEITGDNAGATLSALGVSADNGSTYTSVLETAKDAQIQLDGIATVISRDSNAMSDVIAGLTFDLFKAEVGTTVTIEIDSDLTAVRSKIDDFVNAYNEVRAFIKTQQQIDGDGNVSQDAILFGDNLVRTATQRLSTDLASLVEGLGSTAISTLRDIGIELDSDNLLTVDETKLNSALVDKIDEVRALFEFSFTSDSPNILLIARDKTLNVGDFTIVAPAGVINGTNLQVSGVDAFTVNGGTLEGIEGTIYEGMFLAYARDTDDAGAAAENISIQSSLGVAEKLYQSSTQYSDAVSGLITEEINRLTGENTDFLEEITVIDERLLLFQQQLIDKYSRMEQAIAQGEAMTNQLLAMLGISNN